MKATNWQTKALTLFIATVALFLTTACNSENPYEYPFQRITPSAPCGPDVPLTPSMEFVHLKGASDLEINRAFNKRYDRLTPKFERAAAILSKYDERIMRHYILDYEEVGDRFVQERYVESMLADNEVLTDKIVIRIDVTEYVDQSKFPPEHRIPECMDGVPVHFVVIGEVTYRFEKENQE